MICAMVLAAGRSSRMGQQKLLLAVGGRPVIARIVDEVLAGPVDEVFVVVGGDQERIAEALAGRRVHLVVNADARAEMLGSVRCGLAAMPSDSTAAMVVLGDQPDVTAGLIASLIGAFKTAGRGVVVPTCGGRRGHPMLLSMKYRPEILQQYDNVGLRGLLAAHPDDVYELEVAIPGILEDMDSPEDYSKAAARFSTKRSP